LANTSWWEAVALALADLTQKGKSATVNELLLHPYFKAKTRVQGRVGSNNLRAQCWAALQSHTVMESETVNYSPDKRQPPLIFDKKPGGQWIFAGDWEEAGESLREQLKKLHSGPQNEEPRIKRHLTVTFHQSYSYEDFVEGIRPQTTDDGGISYEVRDGLFKSFCNRARQDPKHRYALFIDEINRGNISRIFGELITLIEADKRAWWDEEGQLVDGMEITLPYSGERFGVPKNLDIYATMNTADRSIALMDAALRRRFHFIELMPEPKQITGNQGDGYIPDGEGGLLSLRDLLNAINLRLRYLLHRDQTFGHAYFMEVKDIDSLRRVMVYDIIPMLAEYFYDDWQQIRRVLADDTAPAEHQIITRKILDPGQLFAGAEVDLPEKPDFRVKQPGDITPDALRKIYDSLETPA
jgi:5-methylcytosine-specific restriction endonuclease McrBC GTP-binding regulatory subunit McrB